MYKISEETKKGMYATPEQLGEQLKGLPDDITRCSRDCPFNVNIRLKPGTLTPLALEAFNIEAWEAWYNDSKNLNPYVPVPGEKGEEKIQVEISVQQQSVENLYVEIIRIAPDTIRSGQILKRFQLAQSGEKQLSEGKGSVPIGIYHWEWDGYINDVLDTKLLKDETTYIRAVGVIGSSFRDSAVQLLAQPFKECAEPVDWLDVVIDRNAKTVEVEWRVAFDDGGVSGKRNADTPSFEELKELALKGIKKHWNIPNEIITNKGNYRVNINPIITEDRSAPSLTLQVQARKSFNRSVNASCVCGIIGKIAKNLGKNSSGLLDTTRAWYLQGYFENQRYPKSYIRNYFMMTVAHESGHAVLASYAYKSTGADNYSWVHKGSSKGLLSGYSLPKIGEKGYEKEPFPLADLMKYYEHGIELQAYYAIEYDIKSLIWLSRLTLGN